MAGTIEFPGYPFDLIRLQVRAMGGVYCTPISDISASGWGEPFKDAKGRPINPPWGTPGGGYPQVLLKPEGDGVFHSHDFADPHATLTGGTLAVELEGLTYTFQSSGPVWLPSGYCYDTAHPEYGNVVFGFSPGILCKGGKPAAGDYTPSHFNVDLSKCIGIGVCNGRVIAITVYELDDPTLFVVQLEGTRAQKIAQLYVGYPTSQLRFFFKADGTRASAVAHMARESAVLHLDLVPVRDESGKVIAGAGIESATVALEYLGNEPYRLQSGTESAGNGFTDLQIPPMTRVIAIGYVGNTERRLTVGFSASYHVSHSSTESDIYADPGFGQNEGMYPNSRSSSISGQYTEQIDYLIDGIGVADFSTDVTLTDTSEWNANYSAVAVGSPFGFGKYKSNGKTYPEDPGSGKTFVAKHFHEITEDDYYWDPAYNTMPPLNLWDSPGAYVCPGYLADLSSPTDTASFSHVDRSEWVQLLDVDFTSGALYYIRWTRQYSAVPSGSFPVNFTQQVCRNGDVLSQIAVELEAPGAISTGNLAMIGSTFSVQGFTIDRLDLQFPLNLKGAYTRPTQWFPPADAMALEQHDSVTHSRFAISRHMTGSLKIQSALDAQGNWACSHYIPWTGEGALRFGTHRYADPNWGWNGDTVRFADADGVKVMLYRPVGGITKPLEAVVQQPGVDRFYLDLGAI